MAPKRLLEDPPPASSSEEEDEEETEDDAVEEEGEEEEEEEESAESEEEQDEEDTHKNKNPKSDDNTPLTKTLKPSKNQSSDPGGDESESETESDNSRPSPSASAFTIKPIASKPMKDSVQPQKKSATVKTVSVSGGVKRSKESDDFEKKEAKKNKVSNNGQDEDLKRGSGVSRLWSEDDEVAILKGMIEYQSEKGADPWADLEAFFRFIKENLHVDVSKDQLKNKIKRLKLKYQGNVDKGKDGEAPVLGKEHDSRIFDLSKKIWGGSKENGVAADSAKKKRKPTQSKKKIAALELPNGEVKAEPAASSDLSFFDALVSQGRLFSIPEGAANVMKEALPLMGSAKTKELESKWRKLQEEELKLYLKKVELVRDSAKLILEAMK